MLTLTYALALSVEHKGEGKLAAITTEFNRKRAEPRLRIYGVLVPWVQFERLDEGCRARNFELYVLPAIHLATEECDRDGRRLLTDIEALTMMGRIILKNRPQKSAV